MLISSLSSRLFEVTQNATYRDAAQLASDFIQFHLYNGKTILDTINLSNCTSNLAEETYNPGLYIGGLSVLVNQTQNATMGNFLNNLISNSIKNPTWTGPDGVITEGPTTDIEANYDGSAFKGIFIRELYEAWSRTSKDSDVAKLIQSYVMVQFNALLELAKAPDNDYFSPLWHGPADPKLIPQGQLSALDVFNAAAGMANVEAQPSEPTPTPPVHKQSKAGVIAGSVIGVAAFIAIVALLVVYLVRRRWRSRYGTPDSDEAQVWTTVSASPHTPEIGVTPFSQLSPASNAGIPEKLRNDMDFGHDPTTPTSQIAGSSAVPVSVPRQSTLPESSVNPPSTANAGSDTIPELVQRLNVAIAQLPPRSGGDDASTVSDVPPVYTRSL
ncbi:hypothetical protein QCA50_014355 [Cerrena zonata]|uniref:Glycoside hydrolase family 76 protein n=1 Tax=Cerrena zonata TaxID=2478898 RepID=A0AAW0G0M1_9APHY